MERPGNWEVALYRDERVDLSATSFLYQRASSKLCSCPRVWNVRCRTFLSFHAPHAITKRLTSAPFSAMGDAWLNWPCAQKDLRSGLLLTAFSRYTPLQCVRSG
jgi:hypothetical protein